MSDDDETRFRLLQKLMIWGELDWVDGHPCLRFVDTDIQLNDAEVDLVQYLCATLED